MLLDGDILIPRKKFSYCLRVDRVIENAPWVPPGFLHVTCTRFDISESRQPVFENPSKLHIVVVREVAKGIFRDEQREDWGNTGFPVYYRKWKPVRGQLKLF